MEIGNIKLGLPDNEIELTPYGMTYSERTVEIAREDRTIDGTLVSDIIATKKEFRIEYSSLKGTDLETIIGLYDNLTELSLLVEERTGEWSSYTVKMMPIEKKRVSVLGDWEWEGVVISLIEV